MHSDILYQKLRICFLLGLLASQVKGRPPDCETLIHEKEVNKNQITLEIRHVSEFPVRVIFNEEVSDVLSDELETEKVTGDEWVLSLPNNSTSFDGSFSLNITSEHIALSIVKMDLNGIAICDSGPKLLVHGPCGIQGDLDLSPDKILIRKAAWATGRNYQISIPSYPNFIGYVVDLFFTKPVTDIQPASPSITAVMNNPTHWSLVREWTDSACIKLVDAHFMVSYKEWSDISSLLLNGETLIGNGSSTAFFKNKDYRQALKTDCETFFEKRGDPWFSNQEKARPLWFETRVQSYPQVGVVVDFIFEDAIKELRLWELTSKMISENHWRVHNAGLVTSSNGTVRFPLALYYYHHYHVKLIGLKVNGEIKCGLGIPSTIIVHKKKLQEKSKRLHSKKELNNIYLQIFASLVLIALAMVLSVIIFGAILLRKLKETLWRRRHLYDFPARQQPSNFSNGSEDNYSSINESIHSNSTNISHM